MRNIRLSSLSRDFSESPVGVPYAAKTYVYYSYITVDTTVLFIVYIATYTYFNPDGHHQDIFS
jgi:hypothetical protein